MQKVAVSKNDMKFGNIFEGHGVKMAENGLLHAYHPVGYFHEESSIQGRGITIDLDGDI